MQSTVYLNQSRTREQTRRGVHLMKPREWLLARYKDVTVVDTLIAQKREMQANRNAGEPVYVLRNPDLPDSPESRLKLGRTTCQHIQVTNKCSFCIFRRI